MPGIVQNQYSELKNPVDIQVKKEYGERKTDKEKKIIEALKALEGVKRTLHEVLKL